MESLQTTFVLPEDVPPLLQDAADTLCRIINHASQVRRNTQKILHFIARCISIVENIKAATKEEPSNYKEMIGIIESVQKLDILLANCEVAINNEVSSSESLNPGMIAKWESVRTEFRELLDETYDPEFHVRPTLKEVSSTGPMTITRTRVSDGLLLKQASRAPSPDDTSSSGSTKLDTQPIGGQPASDQRIIRYGEVPPAIEDDIQAYWSNNFGSPPSMPPFYGLPNQPHIPWDQVPSSAGSGSLTTVPVPPFQQPNPSNPVPERARRHPSQSGQGVFQAVVSPSSAASSSSQPTQPLVKSSFIRPEADACRCPIEFENQSRKIRHWQSCCPYNPSLKTYQCPICGAVIGRKDNLNRHMKQCHPA
ncbi:hypothetical protein FRC00_004166 [Tulasnella sp. 408]|nr:hypothetical protein FRC00_004166 [Tulasnella sp. 408]